MGSYVRSHSRKGYYRKDGTYVSPTTVRSHYRGGTTHAYRPSYSTTRPSAHLTTTADKVWRCGRWVHRRLVDGEWVWQWCVDGEWVDVWWGYDPPSTADLEGPIPVVTRRVRIAGPARTSTPATSRGGRNSGDKGISNTKSDEPNNKRSVPDSQVSETRAASHETIRRTTPTGSTASQSRSREGRAPATGLGGTVSQPDAGNEPRSHSMAERVTLEMELDPRDENHVLVRAVDPSSPGTVDLGGYYKSSKQDLKSFCGEIAEIARNDLGKQVVWRMPEGIDANKGCRPAPEYDNRLVGNGTATSLAKGILYVIGFVALAIALYYLAVVVVALLALVLLAPMAGKKR